MKEQSFYNTLTTVVCGEDVDSHGVLKKGWKMFKDGMGDGINSVNRDGLKVIFNQNHRNFTAQFENHITTHFNERLIQYFNMCIESESESELKLKPWQKKEDEKWVTDPLGFNQKR